MRKDFKGVNHGTGRIIINRDKEVFVLKPTEIHLKENGSLKNEPSFAIVLENPPFKFKCVGEISLEMLNEGLADVGYEIIKKV